MSDEELIEGRIITATEILEEERKLGEWAQKEMGKMLEPFFKNVVRILEEKGLIK